MRQESLMKRYIDVYISQAHLWLALGQEIVRYVARAFLLPVYMLIVAVCLCFLLFLASKIESIGGEHKLFP